MDDKDTYEGQEIEKEEYYQLGHKFCERLPISLIHNDLYVPDPSY